MCCCMIKTSLDLSWKSLVIFENLCLLIFKNFCEMPGNICLALGNLFENLWKFSKSGRKSSENYQKHCH